jgi:hypothetical protein
MTSLSAKCLRAWRRIVVVVVIGASAYASVGCTSTITPPSDVADPTTVWLLREAMHTGLVLPPPRPGAPFVEFGFGDWSWFALGNDAWYQSFATVLWPTQGALGRREFAAGDGDELRRAASWAELEPVVVSSERVQALRGELQEAFAARLADAVHQPHLGWTFVPAPDDLGGYWFANTCADAAATWFEALGCEVNWVPIRSSLQVTK